MSNVFRSVYRELSDEEKAAINEIKDRAQALWDALNAAIPVGADGRQIALAKTNLEQSVMWATKALTG